MSTYRGRLTLAAALALMWPLALLYTGGFREGENGGILVAPMVASAILVLVVLGLLEVAAGNAANQERKRLGYLQVVLGADGRTSTSKSIIFVWTIVVAAALTQLSVIVVTGTGLDAVKIFGEDWTSVLLLLGGPFASAVIAKGVVTVQANSNPETKTGLASTASGISGSVGALVPGTPKALDVVQNDAGETDMVDTQYLIFTVVAMVYFVGAYLQRLAGFAHEAPTVAAEIGLPPIPSPLLGLTGLAALTYVGKKAINDRGLRVVTLTPNPVVGGGDVAIQLVNLANSATVNNTHVNFTPSSGTVETRAPKSISDGRLIVVAPAAEETYSVVVTSPHSVAGPIPLTVTKSNP